jgi:DNA-directed RNA polymerase subunit F
MIRENNPLSMAESLEYVKENTEVVGFIKKFSNLSAKEAKEIRKEIESLNLLKIKLEHVSKIIDLIPEDKEDLNKIFIDIGLDENEIEKIINTIKEFR